MKLNKFFSILHLKILVAFVVILRPEVKRINYKGWENSYEISTNDFKLVITPEIGTRIMEYSYRGINVLWQNESQFGKTYKIETKRYVYGGYKTWVAPQGNWEPAWPPDPFWEFAKSNLVVLSTYSVKLIGAPSLKTNTLFIKEISLKSNGEVELLQRVRNISSKEIEVSLWDVTKVKTPCYIVFPLNPKSRFRNGLKFWDKKSEDSNQWEIKGNFCVIWDNGEGGKFGADSPDGWMVYVSQKLLYSKIFPKYEKSEKYPDDGCNIEICPCGSNLEMEVLSPLKKLKPGEEITLPEKWYLSTHTEKIEGIDSVIKLARGFIEKILKD